MNPTISELLDTADRLLKGTGAVSAVAVASAAGAAVAGSAASSVVPAPPASSSSAVSGPTGPVGPAVLPDATAASRCRGAAFALRAALETAVAECLAAHAAPRAIRDGSLRSGFLWLRGCAEAGTVRRARSVWTLLCLGCHYHQYEIGPTADQIRAWHTEVVATVRLLTD
ncbi:hypothetical protein [Streptomyces albus]|uniref:hypothetical protein n=1 Tax=Streptomyces albus TaxID=1888 RepID=UPI000B333FF1|nr:hypothetical protein [Streptomyces albus]